MTTVENLPEVVSREEWLAARTELSVKEKELTRPVTGSTPIHIFRIDKQRQRRRALEGFCRQSPKTSASENGMFSKLTHTAPLNLGNDR
jgi:hypothetical protein